MAEIQTPTKQTGFPPALSILFYVLVVFTCLYVILDIIGRDIDDNLSYDDYDTSYESSSECNVSGILLRGHLDTYGSSTDDDGDTQDIASADDIISAIESAEYDDDIKAVILEIDSYGGSPVAAEEIAQALQTLDKPSYAHIRGAGASAAYWASTGTDTIFASANSDIGSIGATMSYLDYSKYNQKEGITYQEISSGKYKDSGSSERPLSADEKAIFQRDIDIIADNFITQVSKNRNIALNQVRAMADGSTMLGDAALKAGLIDRIAVMNEVYDFIEEDLDTEISICWN